MLPTCVIAWRRLSDALDPPRKAATLLLSLAQRPSPGARTCHSLAHQPHRLLQNAVVHASRPSAPPAQRLGPQAKIVTWPLSLHVAQGTLSQLGVCEACELQRLCPLKRARDRPIPSCAVLGNRQLPFALDDQFAPSLGGCRRRSHVLACYTAFHFEQTTSLSAQFRQPYLQNPGLQLQP